MSLYPRSTGETRAPIGAEAVLGGGSNRRPLYTGLRGEGK